MWEAIQIAWILQQEKGYKTNPKIKCDNSYKNYFLIIKSNLECLVMHTAVITIKVGRTVTYGERQVQLGWSTQKGLQGGWQSSIS